MRLATIILVFIPFIALLTMHLVAGPYNHALLLWGTSIALVFVLVVFDVLIDRGRRSHGT